MSKFNFEDLQQLSLQEFRSIVDSVRPRIYTYRYVWKLKDSESVQLKYISDVRDAHDRFRDFLVNDEKVISALCEYISEIDPAMVAVTDVLKKEFKLEDSVDEKV